MTIQKLIEKLNTIEDKSQTIGILTYDEWLDYYLVNTDITPHKYDSMRIARNNNKCDYYIG